MFFCRIFAIVSIIDGSLLLRTERIKDCLDVFPRNYRDKGCKVQDNGQQWWATDQKWGLQEASWLVIRLTFLCFHWSSGPARYSGEYCLIFLNSDADLPQGSGGPLWPTLGWAPYPLFVLLCRQKIPDWAFMQTLPKTFLYPSTIPGISRSWSKFQGQGIFLRKIAMFSQRAIGKSDGLKFINIKLAFHFPVY